MPRNGNKRGHGKPQAYNVDTNGSPHRRFLQNGADQGKFQQPMLHQHQHTDAGIAEGMGVQSSGFAVTGGGATMGTVVMDEWKHVVGGGAMMRGGSFVGQQGQGRTAGQPYVQKQIGNRKKANGRLLDLQGLTIPAVSTPEPKAEHGQAAPVLEEVLESDLLSTPKRFPTIRSFVTDKDCYVVKDVIVSAKASNMCDGVYIVRATNTGKLHVQKRFALTGASEDIAQSELKVLFQLSKSGGTSHVNLLTDFWYDEPAGRGSIILEYCNAGTLEKLVEDFSTQRERIPESLVLHVFTGVAKALLFCHQGLDVDTGHQERDWNTICHLDIKPNNVFLTNVGKKGEYPRVVLGDFGGATTFEDIVSGRRDRRAQPFGTSGWYAPENTWAVNGTNKGGRYGKPTDIWQCGGLAQVMCLQHDRSPHEPPNQDLVDKGMPCAANYTHYTEATQTAVGKAMVRGARHRISAQELVLTLAKVMAEKGLEFYA